MRIFISFILCAAILTLFVTPAMAGEDGPVTASFDLNTIPEITALKVYTDSSLSILATSLTPTQTYWIKLSVSVTDTMADFGGLRLWMFYGSNGEPNLGNLGYPADNPSTIEKFAWFKASPDDIENGTLYSTWKIAEDPAHPLPSYSDLATGTSLTSYDFVFKVTIGKLATETADPTKNKWHILAIVMDGSSSSGNSSVYNNAGVYGLPMNWYGEISVPGGTKVEWSQAKAGMLFTDSSGVARPSSAGTPVNVLYTCNGNFSEGIKVAADSLSWKKIGNSEQTVALKDSHNNISDTFSLLSTRGAVTNILNEGKSLYGNGSTQILDETGAITMSNNDEGSRVVSDYRLYLSLSNKITYPGTYTGTINYVIINR